MKNHFDGQDWGANGPKLVTNVMKDFCSTKDLEAMNAETCQGIKVFEPLDFNPVPWRNWRRFYEDVDVNEFLRSYSLHLWGRHSSDILLENLEPQQLLYKLALKHCPLTMHEIMQ